MRPAAVRELEAHGAQGSVGFTSSSPNRPHFYFYLFLWMNPERASTAVIRAKKSDGVETFVQTAFLKVVTFVGRYGGFFFKEKSAECITCLNCVWCESKIITNAS